MVFLVATAGSVWDGTDDAAFFAAVLALVALVVVGNGIAVVDLALVDALVVVVDLLAILLKKIQICDDSACGSARETRFAIT